MKDVSFTSTFRRFYVDHFLCNQVPLKGKVLDLGGKKVKRRGVFELPNDTDCDFLNIDPKTNPDFLCSAEEVPVNGNSYDCVLLIETLEHLKRPRKVIQEAYRVLKAEGRIYGTMPFLFPVHGDPDDYQRWTASRLSYELKQAGFKSVHVMPMGSVYGVTWDLFRNYFYGPNITGRAALRLMRLFVPIIKVLDRTARSNKFITTGWSFSAEK